MKKRSKIIFAVIVLFVLFLGGGFYALSYNDIHELSLEYAIDVENSREDVAPDGKIYFKFSEPVSQNVLKDSFKINPPVEGSFSFFSESVGGYARGFSFKPDEYFEHDSEYVVSISGMCSFFATCIDGFDTVFKTVTSPVPRFNADDSSEIDAHKSIRVYFDEVSDYYSHEYVFSPDVSYEVDEQDLYTDISFNEPLQQGVHYELAVNQYKNIYSNGAETRIKNEQYSFSFKTIDPVIITERVPLSEGERVPPQSEVKILFNKYVQYESAESRFEISPEVEGDIGWEDKTLIFSPKDSFKNGEEYTVTLKKGVKAYEDSSFLSDDFTFTFIAERHEKEVTPEQAIIPQITSGKYIDVDLTNQLLTLFEDGRSRGTYQVSSGAWGTPTPVGEFNVINKAELAYSQTYDLYMPYWMAFTYQGHGFHELPFWKYRGGVEYKERESHLGTPVSHGCVRLGVGPAEIAYHFSEVGTLIVIYKQN